MIFAKELEEVIILDKQVLYICNKSRNVFKAIYESISFDPSLVHFE